MCARFSATGLISVVLPVHNGEDCLERSVESILEQTDSHFELVLIDDGSTDATPRLVERFEKQDARVLAVRRSECGGIVQALNDGIGVARGEVIARMDADDVCHRERLRLQREYLIEHPDVGLVGCRAEFGGDRNANAGYAAYVDWINSLLTHEQIALNRFVESPFAHPSVTFRKVLIDKYGGYRDGMFPEDYELWLRWLDAGVRTAKLPDALVTWSDPPDRLSRTDQRYSVRAFYRCKAEYLARWLARHNPWHPDIVMWGAGRETRKRAEFLVEHGVAIRAYVDVDPRKIGQAIHDRPVLDEDGLPPPGECFVVSYVGSRGARDDIRCRLTRRGYGEGVHFIMGA